jgi:tetratricopeptide (TPR) repeat protein
MPLLSIEARDAFENLQSNAVNKWPRRSEGSNRIEPIAKPAFTPSFQLQLEEMIFTIGSCFARNVESELEKRGFSVPMRHIRIADDPDSVDNNQQIFNNYGVTSIFNELQWALDPESPFDPATGFLELMPGRFVDLHLSQLARAVALERAMERRRRITEAMATAAQCRVIIMTLGLVEVWWDALAERYLNVAPPKQFARGHPGRFSLHVLSYSEVLSYLHRTIHLLQRYGRADHKIILTVSPVPLGATFTDQDVAVANTYSKSVLRAAAEEITRAYEHVDYFPSYESVVLSSRAEAWQDDLIHVSPELVALNVARMLDAYVPQSGNVNALESHAADAERDKLWARATGIYRQLLERDPTLTGARLGLARSLGADGDHAAAFRELDKIEQEGPIAATIFRTRLQIIRQNKLKAEFESQNVPPEMLGNAAVLIELAKCAFQFGKLDRVKQYAEKLVAMETATAHGLMFAGRVALQEQDFPEAVRLLQSANEIMKESASGLFQLGRALMGTGDLTAARAAFERACEVLPGFAAAKQQLQKIASLENIAQRSAVP